MIRTLTLWFNHALTKLSNMFPTAHAFESSAASVANKVTIAGSGGSIMGALTSSHFGMWAGIIIGVAGLLINWYFKIQSDRRARISHEAFMKKLTITPTAAMPLEIPGEDD